MLQRRGCFVLNTTGEFCFNGDERGCLKTRFGEITRVFRTAAREASGDAAEMSALVSRRRTEEQKAVP